MRSAGSKKFIIRATRTVTCGKAYGWATLAILETHACRLNSLIEDIWQHTSLQVPTHLE